MKRLLLLGLLLSLNSGCANVVHKRTTMIVSEGVTNTTTESESGRFLFEKEVASKINIATSQTATNYHHSLSAAGLGITGDVDLVNAIGNAVANGIAAGAAGAVKGAK